MFAKSHAFGLWFSGLCLMCMAVAGLVAQDIPLGEASFKDLQRKAGTARVALNELIKGTKVFNPKDAATIAAVEDVARYQIYSFTYPKNIENKTDKGPELNKQFLEAEQQMRAILLSDKNRLNTQALVDLYYGAIISNTATVAKTDNLVSRVNALRMMGSAASLLATRDEASLKAIVNIPTLIKTGDLLLDKVAPFVTKAPDEATRYYALRAVRETLKVNQLLRENLPAKSLNPTKEAICLKAAAQLVTAPPAYALELPKNSAEMEGFRGLRREAIRALANASSPLLPEDFSPVYVLALCINDPGLNPEARLDEMAEAAAGMARMAPLDKNDADYSPEYTLVLIGRFIQKFAERYSTKGNSEFDKANSWKTQAARLTESLDFFRNRYPKNTFIQEMSLTYIDFLLAVEKGQTDFKAVNVEDKLNVWMRDPTKIKRFFKSKPNSALPERVGG